MKENYDFTDAIKRPEIARKLGAKKSVTIRVDEGILDYFRGLAEETGVPYQTLMNLYLRDCVVRERRPTGEWIEAEAAGAESR